MDQTQGIVGRWVLVDTLVEDQLSLLSIGDIDYGEASVRKNLDEVGRELLIPRIKALTPDVPIIHEDAESRGRLWTVHAEAILSPINNIVLAVRAIYVPAGDPLPPPPLVGGIEWKIMDDGRIDTVWDDSMFSLYEVPRSGGSGTGDMSTWVSLLIAPEDRARMKGVIDAGIADPDGQRHAITFRILTRTRTENPGSKQIETFSRVFGDPSGSVKWLRSIAREVTKLSAAPAQETDNHSAALVQATFDLITSKAMFAVDTATWQVFMVSKSWHQFGLKRPDYNYVPNAIHPDDFTAFAAVCAEGSPAGDPRVIRAMQVDGTYLPYSVTASSGHFDSRGKRYVIIAAVPAVTG